jgi:hypothetical protein
MSRTKSTTKATTTATTTPPSPTETADPGKLRGGCHCGAVRFEVAADPSEGATRCNCSVCTKIAASARVVKPAAFRLVAGEAQLSTYEWGAKISKRFFCSCCGVHCFGRGYLEEVGGDYVSVNFNCLDDVDPSAIPLVYWDGRHNNWQAGPRPTPWPIRTAAASG